MIKTIAPAKVTLTLHVTGQRDNGFHDVDSLVTFVDLGDEVCVQCASQTGLHISGPFASDVTDDDKRVITQAAQRAGVDVEMTLNKIVPSPSGIDDISASAAAILRAAMEMSPANFDHGDVLLQAPDLALHNHRQGARVQGVGDAFDALQLPPLHMVLVNPRVKVHRQKSFYLLENKNNSRMVSDLPTWLDSLAFADWLTTQRNDLQMPAVKQAPDVAAVLVGLALTTNVILTRVSGTGPTCFALYPDRDTADAAAADLAHNNPWWWVKSASTISL